MHFQKFTHQRKIYESDLDTLGHVNNASYLKILENVRWDFMTENGYGLDVVKKTQVSPIITKIEIDYKKEVVNRETVTIESQVVELIGSFRLKLSQKIFKEDGQLATVAYYIMSTFDLKNRRAVLPPKEFLKATGISTD